MLDEMLRSAKSDATAAVRKTTWSAGGALLLLVGLGFLSSAAWLVLAELRDAVFASLVCGAAFAGVGLIVIAVAQIRHRNRASSRKDTVQRAFTDASSPWTPVIQAFLVGVDAGRQPRSHKA